MVKRLSKIAFLATVFVLFVADTHAQFVHHDGEALPINLAKSSKASRVGDWFQKYDQIRHQAQMSADEKERSQSLLAKGLTASLFQSSQADADKSAANALLLKMVDRYHHAYADLKEIKELPQTNKLQRGYEQYFYMAGNLFSDYLKIQSNLFATDASGNSIAGQLQQRKSDLESLDLANKNLDSKLRTKFHISAYPW